MEVCMMEWEPLIEKLNISGNTKNTKTDLKLVEAFEELYSEKHFNDGRHTDIINFMKQQVKLMDRIEQSNPLAVKHPEFYAQSLLLKIEDMLGLTVNSDAKENTKSCH